MIIPRRHRSDPCRWPAAVVSVFALFAVPPLGPAVAQDDGAATVALEPGMAELPGPGVPPLWATVPDADRVAQGLQVAPVELYHWVVDPGKAFTVTVAAPAGEATPC